MKLQIALCWHTDVDDIHLGQVYLDVLPPAGALLAHAAPEVEHVVWRVATVYVSPTQPGSPNDRRGVDQYGMYTLFVEPAEGPYHP